MQGDESIGRAALDPNRDVILHPTGKTDRRGVTRPLKGSVLRDCADGPPWLVLRRTAPQIREALRNGSEVEIRFQDMPDPRAAAFTAHEITSRRWLDWNRGGPR